jgi:hemerythrin-like metal-binding protein
MTILWRPAMAVGHDMIDADHQQLVDLINTVELMLRAAGGEASLTATLDQLTHYAQAHFEREENLMRSLQYRRSVEHRQAHRELRTRLDKLRADIEAAKSAAATRRTWSAWSNCCGRGCSTTCSRKTCCSSPCCTGLADRTRLPAPPRQTPPSRRPVPGADKRRQFVARGQTVAVAGELHHPRADGVAAGCG